MEVIAVRKGDLVAPNQPIVRNHQREIGLYFQDSWRLHPRLTFNYGVRWDRQNPPVNLNSVYTRPGYAGVWGVSGVGNLFKPGILAGSVPTTRLVPWVTVAGRSVFSGDEPKPPPGGMDEMFAAAAKP